MVGGVKDLRKGAVSVLISATQTSMLATYNGSILMTNAVNGHLSQQAAQDSLTAVFIILSLDPTATESKPSFHVSGGDGSKRLGHRLHLRKQKWRDPDSNRGHHDFQWRVPCSRLFLVASKSAYLSRIDPRDVCRCSPLFLARWCTNWCTLPCRSLALRFWAAASFRSKACS
jgi:hypothetical protein